MDGEFTNLLGDEKSPYLLRHKDSLIHWQPWNKEVLSIAMERSRPIFLSIGYSTCHWCRLMEKESFCDVEIAKILNESFISIKVDKEELPHISSLYMDFAASLLSGGGGWPLNIFLTPSLKPFFATCYLPQRTRMGMMGFKETLEHIEMVWAGGERDLLLEQSDKIVSIFQEHEGSIGLVLPSDSDYEDGMQQIFEVADPVFGGMTGSLKFPMTYQLMAIMAFAWSRDDSRGLYFVELTLTKMAEGGIFDHLGGGFARYAVDVRWKEPHFEKMLGDNALLASTYLDAWHYLGKNCFQETAVSTLDYLALEFLSKEGAFFLAEGSEDSEEEGRFYTWTRDEITTVLGEKLGNLVADQFHVEGDSNKRSVLFLEGGMSEEARDAKGRLFQEREKRDRPFKDDKIIVSSNALAIEAFAKAGFLLGRSDYTQIAIHAADFIWQNMRIEGQLYRRYRDGDIKIEATFEDYAFYIRALITLFECNLGAKYFAWATLLFDEVEEELKAEDGAFYQAKEESSPLYQKCNFSDGSEPSGNAVHAENLLRMYQLTFEEGYYQQAEDIFKAGRDHIVMHAINAGYMLRALGRLVEHKSGVICIALNDEGDLKKEIEALLRTYYLPHYSVLWLCGEVVNRRELDEMIPIEGQTTVYICKHRKCDKPYINLHEIEKAFTSL